jgi:hypothetical protein
VSGSASAILRRDEANEVGQIKQGSDAPCRIAH